MAETIFASESISAAPSFDLASGATSLGVVSEKSRSELESESSPLPVTFLTPALSIADVASPLDLAPVAAHQESPENVPTSLDTTLTRVSTTQNGRSIIVLPRMIYIVDHRGYYLGVDATGGIGFRGPSPNSSSIFEAIQYNHGGVRFRAANGEMLSVFGRFGDANGEVFVPIACAGTAEWDGWIFRITHSSGNRIFIHFSDMPGTVGTMFKTNESILMNMPGLPGRPPVLYLQARQRMAAETEIFEIRQPIISRDILLATYDINSSRIQAEPTYAAYSTIVNNPSSSVVTQTLNYSYTRSVVGTWNNALGWEIGSSVTFRAGIPFIASAEYQISVSASGVHEWGGSSGEERTFESSTAVEVQPQTSVRVTVMVRRATLDINFSYDERIIYLNGSTETTRKLGIYHNVESYHVDVVATDLRRI